MRNVHLFCFTNQGERLAATIAETLATDESLNVRRERVESLQASTEKAFAQGNVLIYIGAMGIAVRAVSPLLKSKMTDPAVLVIDELGRFVIPVLSGHVGGANQMAMKIATQLGATPVITTATDVNRVFAVDVFAVQNGCHIANPEMIKIVSARLLEGKDVGLASEFEIIGDLPPHIILTDNAKVGVVIGRQNPSPFEKTFRLVPKCYHVGVGAKRDKTFPDLHAFFLETLCALQIPVECVAAISSIDLKKNEPAIVALTERYRIAFKTYTAEEMQPHEEKFESSGFVKTTTGVGNVCEIAAWLSSRRGRIVLKKKSQTGMTLAVAEERRPIRFDASNAESERGVP